MRCLTELPAEVRREYAEMRVRPDGVIMGVHRLLFHWTLHIDIDDIGYADRYCFNHVDDALEALRSWNGEGDPAQSWHRHPKSGRRRDPVTGREWFEP